MEAIGFLLGVLFFIILEGIFAGAEIALISTDRSKVLALYRKTGYGFLRDFHENPEEYITLSMLGYTISIVFASTFYTLMVITLSDYLPYIKGYEVLFSLTLVIFTLLFGEIIPKSVFQKYSDKLLIPSLWYLSKIRVITFPVLVLSRKVSRYLTEFFRKRYSERISKIDIIKLLEEIELQESRIKIAVKLLTLRESTVSEIVKPIYEVVMIDEFSTVGHALRRMKESGFTKLPVYKQRVDDITGYVDMFDIMDAPPSSLVREFIKPVSIFSEFTPLQDVLETFRGGSSRMGLVVDERGIILGIVTFDDVIREILGQIGDSFAQPEEPIKEIEKDKWIVDGMLDKHEFEKVAGIKFPEGPFLTLGGFIIYQLKRIPKKGEVVFCCGLRFLVLQSDRRKVKKLMVERHVQEQKAQGHTERAKT